MKTFKEYLDDVISTANLGPTSNYVGTRKDRKGDGPDSFVQGVPGNSSGKKIKNKAIKKASNNSIMLQQRALPFEGGGESPLIDDIGEVQ